MGTRAQRTLPCTGTHDRALSKTIILHSCALVQCCPCIASGTWLKIVGKGIVVSQRKATHTLSWTLQSCSFDPLWISLDLFYFLENISLVFPCIKSYEFLIFLATTLKKNTSVSTICTKGNIFDPFSSKSNIEIKKGSNRRIKWGQTKRFIKSQQLPYLLCKLWEAFAISTL